MSDIHYLNGFHVDGDNFRSLEKNLQALNLETGDAFSDGMLTSDEIKSILDVDRNDRFEMSDIRSIKKISGEILFPSLFLILKQQGFNLYSETADWHSFLDGYLVESRDFLYNIRYQFLWSDSHFVKTAIAYQSRLLKYAHKDLRDDQEIVLAAVANYYTGLYYAGDAIKTNPDFAKKVIELDARAFPYLDLAFRKDPDIVRLAVAKFGQNLRYVDPEFKSDRPIVLSALKNDGNALQYVTPWLTYDESIAKAALTENPLALRFVPADHPEITSLTEFALQQDLRALWHANFTKLGPEWWQDTLIRHNLQIPPEAEALTPEELMTELKSITLYPERFDSVQTILTLWANRKRLPSPWDDTRPKAVLIYNKDDGNGAFAQFHLMDKMINSGKFNVLYYETDSEIGVKAALEDATANGTQPVHTLVLAGHGDKLSLQFGATEYSRNPFNEQKFIDRGDFSHGFFRDISKQMDPQGQVLLYACSTAQGSDNENNVTRAIASQLPSSMTVYASRVTNNINDVTFNDDLSLNIVWTWGNGYQTQGTGETHDLVRTSVTPVPSKTQELIHAQ